MSFTRNNKAYFDMLMRKDWSVQGRYFNLEKMGYTWGYTWGYNNRKSALGVHKGIKKRIEISKSIFDCNPEINLFDNTIRHEIAHAIDFALRGVTDHSFHWKRVAREIGCNADVSAKIDNTPKGKYTLRCPNGHETQAYRRPKRARSCGICDTAYNPVYKMEVIQNY